MKEVLNIGKMQWIHFTDPEKKEVEAIVDKYQLHELIEQDLLDTKSPQDKMDVYDDCIFLIIHFPKFNPKTKKYFSNEMDVIMGKDFIITMTNYQTNNISKIRNQYEEELKEENPEDFKISPYYVLYKIIDAMYDKALIGLNKFNLDLIKIEEKAFDAENVDAQLLEELLIKKRNAVTLRHLIFPQIEILRELQNATMTFYEGDLDVYFEDLQYKTDKILSNIAMVKENTESIFDISDTLTTMRTNTVISLLTIFTAVIGIMTMISGLFGMNLDLPLDDNPYGFIILLGVMITIAALMVRFFKKKKWL